MPPPSSLPQELIDKIIDELAEVYWDVYRVQHPEDRVVACEALHACSLVSRNWVGRSRTHLFKRVKIRVGAVRDSGRSSVPSKSLMPYIAKLWIHLRSKHYRLFPSPKLLKRFHSAPITHLGITEAALAPSQGSLVECVAALSATLRTVTFKTCSLPLQLIIDIVLKHPGLKRLFISYCAIQPTNQDNHVMPRPDARPTDLELGIYSGADGRGQDIALITVAQLPIRFNRLDFDYFPGPRTSTDRSSNTLIKASAESLSYLTVHIVTSTPQMPEAESLFSLDGCLNLSELTLDMEDTDLCLLTTSTDILSTFDRTQGARLKRIKLITTCIYKWLCNGSRDQLAQAWSNLDTILSKLARVVNTTDGEKLTFSLASAQGGKCVPFGRKWLPERLHCFHQLGESRVEHLEADSSHLCLCDHGKICLEEERGSLYSSE